MYHGDTIGTDCSGPQFLSCEFTPDHLDRVIVPVDHSLLQWNDRIVSNVDASRADICTTFCYVAIADTEVILHLGYSIFLVHWMHLEISQPDHCSGASEFVELLVFPEHVAGVLADEAFNAHPEFLHPHRLELTEPPIWFFRTFDRCNFFCHLVIPGNIGDQVFDVRKSPHWSDTDVGTFWSLLKQVAHPCHAHQTWFSIDLCTA